MIKLEFLRKWQGEAFKGWITGRCKGIFLGCTGSGKSIAAMYCIQRVKKNTIIVVPTIALMNQWIDELAKNLDMEISDIGRIGDGSNNIKPITVAVINSTRELDLSFFEMIVLDEVHRYGSIENIKPLLNNHFKYKLGVTATLKRLDGQDVVLEELIGPVVYEYNTKDAVDDGVLSKFEIINCKVDLSSTEMDKYKKYTKTIDENSFADMYEAMKNKAHSKWMQAVNAVRATSWRKAVISNAAAKMTKLLEIVKQEEGKKIIIFNETIKMAEAERKLLKKNGYIAEVYHSKSKNQSAIDKFKSGEVKILISVKSLNEGLDVKDVDVGIRVAGTSQNRDTIQRLGRSLRVVEGKSSARYYQIYCDNTLEKWQIIKNTNAVKSAADKVIWD